MNLFDSPLVQLLGKQLQAQVAPKPAATAPVAPAAPPPAPAMPTAMQGSLLNPAPAQPQEAQQAGQDTPFSLAQSSRQPRTAFFAPDLNSSALVSLIRGR